MKQSLPPQPVLLPSPVLVIGTYGPDGRPDIMTAAWAGIAASKPPAISVSLREATLTYHNIKETGAFTVNIPSEKHLVQADFAGMVSGRTADKFKEAGLTPVKSERVNAPLVAEFPYALECRLVRQVELGSHTMFIGEIVGLTADDSVLDPGRLPDIEKVRPMMFAASGARAYYGVGAKLGTAFSSGNALRKKGGADDRL
jgi:flavin reductase (DIM6/NTAB) family NADH-FMN oxidoreductase RutF